MLAEYLTGRNMAGETVWTEGISGLRACACSLSAEHAASPHLPAALETSHFETFFCCRGTLTLFFKTGQACQVNRGEVLLLSDASNLAAAQFTAPLEGVLVAADGAVARESLSHLCTLLGAGTLDTKQVKEQMAKRQGCAIVGESPWTQALFGELEVLSRQEQARYCVLKAVEVLYLLITQSRLLGGRETLTPPSRGLDRAVVEMGQYMAAHMEEKLTIQALSRRCCLSSTAFKENFRRIYGQPVHRWLQDRRMDRAAQLLCQSSMTVLEVAQAVGYEGVSQFNVVFKRRYGMPPRQFRKMSEPGKN